MVPGIFPSQLEILSTGQTYFEIVVTALLTTLLTTVYAMQQNHFHG